MTTTFAPSSYCLWYLPRTPSPRSRRLYSGRRSSFSIVLMVSSFSPCHATARDNSDGITSVCMCYYERLICRGNPEGQITELALRMIRIAEGERQRIAEHCGCLIEANAMFSLVYFRFIWIPFEPHKDDPLLLSNHLFVQPVKVLPHDLLDLIFRIPTLDQPIPDDRHAVRAVHGRHVERPVGGAELCALFFGQDP